MSAGCEFYGDKHCMCEACHSMRGLLQELEATSPDGSGTRAEEVLQEMREALAKADESCATRKDRE